MPADPSRRLTAAAVCNALSVVCAFGLIYGTLSIPTARALFADQIGDDGLPEFSVLVLGNYSVLLALAGAWAIAAVAFAWRFRSAPTPAVLSVTLCVSMTAQAALTTLALLLPFVRLVQVVGMAE